MGDLQNPRLMYLKGLLFLLIGVLSAAMLILDHPTLRDAAFLLLSIWAFARLYYFIFYVIEHYIDPAYRFAGLGSFAMYLLRKSKSKQ